MEYRFEAKVFRWESNPAFFMLSLPLEASQEIHEISEGLTNGFGSLKVEATIGTFTWKTSIFPESKTGCFDLPLKAEVRKRNSLVEGSVTTVKVKVLGF